LINPENYLEFLKNWFPSPWSILVVFATVSHLTDIFQKCSIER
jgi:hypothetical protein